MTVHRLQRPGVNNQTKILDHSLQLCGLFNCSCKHRHASLVDGGEEAQYILWSSITHGHQVLEIVFMLCATLTKTQLKHEW